MLLIRYYLFAATPVDYGLLSNYATADHAPFYPTTSYNIQQYTDCTTLLEYHFTKLRAYLPTIIRPIIAHNIIIL